MFRPSVKKAKTSNYEVIYYTVVLKKIGNNPKK